MRGVLRTQLNSLAGLALVCGLSSGLPAANAMQAMAQAVPADLAGHRAVYDLKLADAEEQSGVAGLQGRMVYEFSGSACEGYSVNFRFVTKFQDMNGGAQVTDLQTSSFEEHETRSYQFLSKTFVDEKLVESSRGTATAGDQAVTVTLKEPAEKSVDMNLDVQFPTEHLMTVLEAARAGKHFLAIDVFDGAETGDKVYSTTTVIGTQQTADKDRVAGRPVSDLEGTTYWPVTVAYFDTSTDDASGELTPVYQLSFWLYENGVSDHLVLDYGDFVLEGKMTDLELYTPAECD